MRFADLVDVTAMERLCDGFSAVTGMAMALMDTDGSWLTRTNWRPICSLYHRAFPVTEARCRESDADLARRLDLGEPFSIHRCRNGLVDVAVPVVLADERVANFYAGQFFLEPPDRAFFEAQARMFGFDTAAYLSALDEVPIIPSEHVRTIIGFFSELARVIGESGLARRRLEEASRATAASEALLRKSEERLRVVVEFAQEGIAKRQQDGAISVFNPAAERITGLTASQARGLTPCPPGWYTVREDGSLLPAEERPDTVALRTGKRVSNVVLGTHHPDGDVTWCSVNSEPVFRDGQAEPYAVVATYTDITARRKQAALQRQLEEQLQEARKLESIGRLAGGIAHDFNNLLTVILAGTQELRVAVDSGMAAAPEVIDEIQAASKRAAELTSQLLAFARKQVVAPVALDLNSVVQRSEKLLRRVLGENIELATRTAADLWAMRCDPSQLDLAILNLAINARDAMPSGGKLALETANVRVDGDFVAQHPFMHVGEYVRLTVADTGQGMTPEVKARAFDPFFTTKPQGKGTGLGLATVYGIMQQSEGYILLDSALGRGTTFSLYFPRTDETPEVAPLPRAACGGSETVLVVEDDPQVRAVTLRALRSGGYRVLEASAAKEALEVAAREEGPIHLVVTDVIMPGLNGRQLVSELQRQRPELTALLVSGYPGDVVSHASTVEPEVELLPKPFTTAGLLVRARALLDKRLTDMPVDRSVGS